MATPTSKQLGRELHRQGCSGCSATSPCQHQQRSVNHLPVFCFVFFCTNERRANKVQTERRTRLPLASPGASATLRQCCLSPPRPGFTVKEDILHLRATCSESAFRSHRSTIWLWLCGQCGAFTYFWSVTAQNQVSLRSSLNPIIHFTSLNFFHAELSRTSQI